MAQLTDDQIAYCTDLARRYCPDLFRASLFVKADIRSYLWAILAFYGEVSQVKYQVSQIEMGQIRLQWWRDEIVKIFNDRVDKAGQSLSACLSVIIQGYSDNGGLYQDDFLAIIDGVEADIATTIPKDFLALQSLTTSIYKPLFYLIAKILSGESERYQFSDNDMAYTINMAQAFGIIDLMMHFPHHVRMGRCYLPEQMLEASGISLSSIMHLKAKDKELRYKLPKLVDKILSYAENSLESIDLSDDFVHNYRFFDVLMQTCGIHANNIRKRRCNILVMPRGSYFIILPIKLWWRC